MRDPGGRILSRPVFGRLLFSQCWEDPRMDDAALRPGPGDTILSVVSGGCNTLSLALRRPARVIAVDLNPAQCALLELKIAGALALDHGRYLELLGVRPSPRRRELYAAARARLPAPARDYWDPRVGAIEGGVLRAGRYERYLEGFRRLLVLLQGRRRIEGLFEPRTPVERREYYESRWDTLPWRLFFRVFFSRTVLGRAGLDPAFFTYADGVGGFGDHFLARARHALVDLPARDNFFLAQICLGRYLDERALPPCLLEENFDALREGAERIEVVCGELGEVLRGLPESSVDRFNLSNVFEWVPPPVFEAMLREIHRVSRPGGRLCYRNLLVRRRHPPGMDRLFRAEDGLAARLLLEDRSFVYSRFEVASVAKPVRKEAVPSCATACSGDS